MSNETWIEQAEAITLFRNQGKGGEATRLLEMSPTNRTINGRKQAIMLSVLRFAGLHYESIYPDENKYQLFNNVADIIEGYQLTLDGEQNSRRQFMKVAIAGIMQMLYHRSHGNDKIGGEIGDTVK